MEPLSTATALATIIGLIGQFKAERKASATDDFETFLLWLTDSNHAELKRIIESNAQATKGLKSVLEDDREALLEKLEALDDTVSRVASTMDGFADIAAALHPTADVPKQARSILTQLVNSGGSSFIEAKTLSASPYFMILGGTGSMIDYDEPQFVADDISTLIELGLLKRDYNDQGDSLYLVTRSAAKLVATWQSPVTEQH